MFNLAVSFGPQGLIWAFLFKKKAAAEEARNAVLQAREAVNHQLTVQGTRTAEIVDDYGSTASIDAAAIHGVMLENLDDTSMAQIERGLQQARTQTQANRMAMQDPVLKTAQMLQGLGGAGHPFANGPNRAM
jgi:hypothetical protein